MAQELELWREPDGTWGPNPGTDTGSDPGVETSETGQDEAVRHWTTDRLQVLIKNLTPYIDGTFGTVSTKHAQVYMSAVRELNKLWHAYYTPEPVDPVGIDEAEAELVRAEAAQVTRNKVLAQLEELRARTRH